MKEKKIKKKVKRKREKRLKKKERERSFGGNFFNEVLTCVQENLVLLIDIETNYVLNLYFFYSSKS